jgi:hypothetical protein
MNFPAFGQIAQWQSSPESFGVGRAKKFARFADQNKCQGSSVVEQGTHKPLVGSSNLPPGTALLLGPRKIGL